uniref:Uncharacterized protein n=1 Tax=Nicotiana tabacum TaxID=4097 RepID=A0A1S4DHC5_TOBAC|nr:PREDICTED: uncharacterized protein LOC107829712 [Nicotiana tabacum]
MAENDERPVIEAVRPSLANMNQAIVKPDITGHFELQQYMVKLIQSIGNFVQAINLRSGKALEEFPHKKYVPKEVFERLVPQPEVEAEKKDVEHRQEIEVRPPPPFPQRLQKSKDESKYKKFLDILSQVRVNLPLIEVLQEVPKYAKHLRDIVANKRRLTEFETVVLTEECNTRVQSKLPPKLKDPGYFIIPLAIGKHEVSRAWE